MSTITSFEDMNKISMDGKNPVLLPLEKGIEDIENGAAYKLALVMSKDNYWLLSKNGEKAPSKEDNVIVPSLYSGLKNKIEVKYGISEENLYQFDSYTSLFLALGAQMNGNETDVPSTTLNFNFAILPQPYTYQVLSDPLLSAYKLVENIQLNEFLALFIPESIANASYTKVYVEEIEKNLKDLVERDCHETVAMLAGEGDEENKQKFGLTTQTLKKIQFGLNDKKEIVNLNNLKYIYPKMTKEEVQSYYPNLKEDFFWKNF